MPFQLSVSFHGRMFENIISIVKTNKSTASKKFTATKNHVLFEAFEVTCIFPLSHDIISFPKIMVTLVQDSKATVEAFHTDISAPMLHIYNEIFIYDFISLGYRGR